MKKQVLDVGNCSADHGAIRRLLEERHGDEVVQAHTGAEALQALRQGAFDLVLVNRRLDRDYSEGIEVIRAIKSNPELGKTPVMLITNYDEHQQAAMAAGALRGFGKAHLGDAETAERLAQVLG